MNPPLKPPPAPQLPLWRLELNLEQALRRLKRTEEAFNTATAEVERIMEEIRQRRASMDTSTHKGETV